MLLFEKRMECLDVLFAIQNWLRHRHEPGAVSLFLKVCEALACAGLGASVQIQATKVHVCLWINEVLYDLILQKYERFFPCLRLDQKPTT